jgi:hypothetical protein
MQVTEIAEVVDGVTGAVREGAACGTRTINHDGGFTLAVLGDAGDARVGVRNGEVLATRAAWFGATGSLEFGRDGAAHVEAALQWLVAPTASPAVDAYPTSGTNGAVLARVDLASLGTFDSGTISWTQITPAGTTVAVATSDDEGATWDAQSNGGAVASLSNGQDVSATVLLIRVTLASTDPDATPEFHGLSVAIKGEDPSIQDFGTDGTLTGTLAPDAQFLGGQVVWITGENAGLSMEIREWDSSSRTIRLWLPMPMDVAAGDEFDIRPGCQKRFLEDCRDRFGHDGDGAPNFRGEPYIPGTDQITKLPDGQ